jgi:hypothetical protein
MTRTLLVLGFVLVWALLVLLIFRAWRKRGERQRELVGPLPTPPAELGAQLLASMTGVYIGSTMAPRWIDRVAVGDFGARSASELSAYEAGVLMRRQGASDIWIPRGSIVGVRMDWGLAGKVMTKDGLLVIRWRSAGGAEIDTGFRGDDKTVYSDWVRQLDRSRFQSGKNGADA